MAAGRGDVSAAICGDGDIGLLGFDDSASSGQISSLVPREASSASLFAANTGTAGQCFTEGSRSFGSGLHLYSPFPSTSAKFPPKARPALRVPMPLAGNSSSGPAASAGPSSSSRLGPPGQPPCSPKRASFLAGSAGAEGESIGKGLPINSAGIGSTGAALGSMGDDVLEPSNLDPPLTTQSAYPPSFPTPGEGPYSSSTEAGLHPNASSPASMSQSRLTPPKPKLHRSSNGSATCGTGVPEPKSRKGMVANADAGDISSSQAGDGQTYYLRLAEAQTLLWSSNAVPGAARLLSNKRESVGAGDLSCPSPGLMQNIAGFSPVVAEMPLQSAFHEGEVASAYAQNKQALEQDQPMRRSSTGGEKVQRRASRASSPGGQHGIHMGSVAQRAAAAAVARNIGAGIDVPSRRTSLNNICSMSPSIATKRLEHEGNAPPRVASSTGEQERSKGKGKGAAKPAVSQIPAFDRQALQRWILSVGCVTFDLDLGPDLEFLYPPLGISKEEKDNIAFSSFPDTSIFDDGYTTFSWRVREVPLHSSYSEAPVIGRLNKPPPPGPSPAASSFSSSPDRNVPVSPIDTTSSDSVKESPLPSPTTSAFAHRHASHASLQPQSASRSAPPPPSTASALGPNGGGSALNGKLLSQHPSMASIAAETSHSRNNSATSTGTTEPSAAALSNLPGANSTDVDLCSSLIMRDLEVRTAGGLAIDHDAEEKQDRAAAPACAAAEAPNAVTRKGGGSTSSSYIYGVCFFRQKRDPSIRRGYFQKSVVILSHLPYVSLLTELVSKLGPLYFEHGQPMLEAFIQDVVRWPAPESGVTLTLPALGSVLKVSLPIGSQFQTDAATNAYIPSLTNPNMATSLLTKKKITQPGRQPEPEPLLASIPTTPLIDTFRDALADLWLLWECMLLADPILVIGPDPKACSDAVWHLLDLIRPIPYAGDFRPYFHIHDYDCGALVTKNKPQAGTLLGVTNPFFVAACGHWPNLLRVGRPAPKVTHHFGIGRSGSASKKPTAPGVAGGMSAGGGGPDHQPGLASKRKRRASKDRPLLKAMVDAVEKQEGVEAANGMLRRYFSDLTERFLQPLNRYIASLVPSSGAIPTLPGEPLRIKPFNTNDFLGSLKAHGTPLLLKNRNLPTGAAIRQSLYLDFLKCPNFSLWLHAKLAAADDDNWRRRIKVLEMGDVQRFAQRNGEIETIDLLSRLREEIKNVDARIAADQSSVGPGRRWRTDERAPPSRADSAASSNFEPSFGAGTTSIGVGSGHSASATAGSSTDGSTAAHSFSSLSAAATPASTFASAPPGAKQGAPMPPRHLPSRQGSSSTDSFSGGCGGGVIDENANAGVGTGTYGRTLAAKKHKLLDQLDRLAEVLSPDLKSSLRLKECERERGRVTKRGTETVSPVAQSYKDGAAIPAPGGDRNGGRIDNVSGSERGSADGSMT